MEYGSLIEERKYNKKKQQIFFSITLRESIEILYIQLRKPTGIS